ncbi:MAG: hypothetical protein WCI03_06620 [bacterium]|jgi:hypothetical protein
MDNFWKWLKQANARAVFFCLLAALMAVTAWWGWKLMTPIGMAPSPVTGTTNELTTPGLGILAYLHAQQIEGTNRAANLFTPAEGFSQTQPSPPKKDNLELSNSPSKPSIQPTPAHPKENITLTYRGLYMRRDGVPMALIFDSKSKKTSFYPAGTNLFGMILTSIKEESLGVDRPDQASVTLKRGIPQSFLEIRHAD